MCIKETLLWWLRFINKLIFQRKTFFIIREINGLTAQTRVVGIINA